MFFTYDGGKTWEGFGKAPFGCYDDEEAQIVDVADVTCGAEPMYAVTFKNGDKITRYAGGDPMEWMYSEVLSWQEVPADLDGYRLKGVMVDYDLLFRNRLPLLRKAYERSSVTTIQAYVDFERKNYWWLDDYALFMAVKDSLGGISWIEWDKDIKLRKASAHAKYREELKEEIAF